MKNRALVIGAGAFGTSMAQVISANFKTIIAKVRSKDVYESISKGENSIYLPGQKIADNIVPALTWDEAFTDGKNFDLIVFGLPTSAIIPFCHENKDILSELLDRKIPIISLCKGIDSEKLLFPDDLFFQFFPNHQDQFCFLSGPSFAKEIIDEQITIVSMAGNNKKLLLDTCKMIQTDYFKAFPTTDIKGVLLGGALKNIIAIAGGIVEGLGYNHNTRAALITRGIIEMLRFGEIFGARPETFYSFSGMGDLILTTTGDLSRNKSFGQKIANGKSATEIIESQRSVVEGYKTTKAAYLLAEKHNIQTRIFDGMYRILYQDVLPQDIISELMKLPSRFDEE